MKRISPNLGYLKPKTPIKCIASIEKRLADNLLLRGEENANPEDIKGKTIGFMPRTTSHSFLMRFLEHYNINKQNIRLKPISPQAMPDAFIRGDVDVISCWYPYADLTMSSMDELGLSYTHFQNTGFYESEVVLATTKPFLIKNKHLLEKLLRALKAAEIYMQENWEETKPVFINTLKLSGRNKNEVIKKYKPALNIINQPYLENIEMLGKWIRDNDTEFKGTPLPDYTDLVDNSVFLDIFPRNPV